MPFHWREYLMVAEQMVQRTHRECHVRTAGMRTEKPNVPSAEALPPPAPVAPSNSRLEGMLMPKGKSVPEATVSPEDVEVIGVKGEQVKFRNMKTGEVYEPSRFMNVPGFEGHIQKAMLLNRGGFQAGVGK